MMRIPRRWPLILTAGLGACSSGDTSSEANGVDVAAAAQRGQSDIANYAAASRSAAAPTAAPAPVAAPAARVAAAARPVASAPVTAGPEAVVRRYFDAIAAGRYAEAWGLWDGGGAAAGVSQAAFARSFDRYASYRARIGTPSDEDAGAGQRFVTVPVTVTGTLRSGEPFRLEGPVVLHKVADGIESDDPDAHAWRIRNSELKPRPGGTAGSAP